MVRGRRTPRPTRRLPNRRLYIDETQSEVDGRIMTADVKSRASRRTLDLPKVVHNALAEHLAARQPGPNDLVFTASDGTPVRASNFRNRIWPRALEAAGLADQGLTFHHLRHSAVGYLIDANAPAAVMQRRMGHASIRTTLDVYGHVLPATDKETTDRLDNLFPDADPDPAQEDDSPDLP